MILPNQKRRFRQQTCEFHLREQGFECHLTICSSLLVAKIGIERANMEDRGKLDTSLVAHVEVATIS